MEHIGFYSAEGWEKERLTEALGEEVSVTYIDHALGDADIEAAEAFTMLIIRPDSELTKERLAALPNLKHVLTRSTGFDHIDLAAAKSRGVTVQNVPEYGSATVAEHAFALLLCLSKRVFDGYEQVRERSDFDPRKLRGFDLFGKTIGVVGTGAIGRHAVSMARGFGMTVLAYDVRPDAAYAAAHEVRYVSLEELLESSDIVTLHVPANEGTRHLINCDNVSRMKMGSVLINTSRGAVVETQAIVMGLAEGRIRGAGLDVFEDESLVRDELHLLARDTMKEEDFRLLVANHVLIDHPDVIVTPHSAYNTEEALARILETTLENIRSADTDAPTNLVT